MSDDVIPPPVPRLDAVALVEAVNREGVGLRLVGRAGPGEVGAAFVKWPDGASGVITRTRAGTDELTRTRWVLARAADAGVPVPRYQLVVDLGHERAIVQQRLPGDPPDVVDAPVVERLIEVSDRLAGLGAGIAPIALHLDDSGPGFCLHETLARSGARTRRLLDRVRDVGGRGGEEVGSDLVHLDFHPGNVLVDAEGGVAGIVDWDGYGSGDRRFMLVTMLFDLLHGIRFRPAYRSLGTEGLAPLVRRLATAPVDSVRRWWAHMSLRQVDWALRHGYPAGEVDHYLVLAERGLDRLDAGEHVRTADVVIR